MGWQCEYAEQVFSCAASVPEQLTTARRCGEEPGAGELVMIPVNLNRLNRPNNPQKDIYKIYTLRQVAIMRLYGMNKFSKNQWIYTSTNSPVFRSAENPDTTEAQPITK